MVKAPRMGQVKTRLAAQVGHCAATMFYRQAAAAVIARLASDTRWQTWLAVAPDTATGARWWSRHVPRRGQGAGDLGRRMQAIMGWPGGGPIVIVGTDIPAIRPAHIAAAFATAGACDVVFGPAVDGGYWLIGQRRVPRRRQGLREVRWSSPHALADSMASFGSCRIGMVDVLGDVDDATDLTAVRAWSGRRVPPVAVAPRLSSTDATMV